MLVAAGFPAGGFGLSTFHMERYELQTEKNQKNTPRTQIVVYYTVYFQPNGVEDHSSETIMCNQSS